MHVRWLAQGDLHTCRVKHETRNPSIPNPTFYQWTIDVTLYLFRLKCSRVEMYYGSKCTTMYYRTLRRNYLWILVLTSTSVRASLSSMLLPGYQYHSTGTVHVVSVEPEFLAYAIQFHQFRTHPPGRDFRRHPPCFTMNYCRLDTTSKLSFFRLLLKLMINIRM